MFSGIGRIYFGNIGGYVPTITNNLSTTTQYTVAIGFLIITIIFCVMLIRKKEN